MALVAVLSLALGIGANAAIFSVAHAFLLRVWQVRDPQTLVFVRARSTDGERIADFPWTTVQRLRLPTKSLVGLSAFDGSTVTVTIDGEPEIVHADFVTGDYLPLLGIETPLGRALTPDDDLPGRPPVAVISHTYWRHRFNADPHVLGKTVGLKSLVCTIVGVTSPTYFGRQTAGDAPSLMLPMAWHDALGLKDHVTFELLGRLRDDVSPEVARGELDALYQQAVADEPSASPRPVGASAPLPASHIELQSATRGDFDDERFAREVWILQLVAGLVLLLAAINVAGLQLARGVRRERELATRVALGATRARVIRQLLAESLLVSAAGGLLGLCAAQWGADALLILTLGNAPSPALGVETPIVVFTLAMVVLCTVLCGTVPALRLTRSDPIAGVATSLRARGGGHSSHAGWSLIVAQVALSIVLLITAGLLVQSIRRLAHVDLGFDPSSIAVMSVYPTLAGYEGPRELELYQRLLDRLNALPGVKTASMSRFPILRRARWRGLIIHGDRTVADPAASFVVDAVAPRLFEVLGLHLVAGRDFALGDSARSAPVAVINEVLADRYFPGGRAIGRTLEFENVRREVIGVVRNMRFGVRDEGPVPAVYIAFTQAPPEMLGQMFVKVRTFGQPSAMMPTIQREIRQVAPGLTAAWAETAGDSIANASSAEASLAGLVTTAGAVALFLAMVGLYGTLAQAVTRRTREIGLRMALGARAHDVGTMILRDAGRLVLSGIAIGVPSAWASARLVQSFLFGVSPSNLFITAYCCVLVVAVSTVAGLAPALRAARVDPLLALQQE